MNAKQIAQLVAVGHDFSQYRVKAVRKDELTLLSYTHEAQWANEWTEIEQLCRGLIVNNQTGDIVARPFKKFFNYGQEYGDNVAVPDENDILENVFEKMDGSLIIGYKYNGEMNFATRGSFDSDQAIWAKTHFDKHFYSNEMHDNYTYLFEGIYPENRVLSPLVVDYGAMEALVLLALINTHTGQELPWASVVKFANYMGFSTPTVYNINSPEEALRVANKLSGAKSEGFVLRYKSGERFKIKGDDYIFLHRIISNISKKNVFEMWRNNESMPDIPDEFIVQIDNWYNEFDIVKQDIYEECLSVFSIAPKETKRDFALAVKSHKYSSILFAMWDDNSQLIVKTLLDAVKRECEI